MGINILLKKFKKMEKQSQGYAITWIYIIADWDFVGLLFSIKLKCKNKVNVLLPRRIIFVCFVTSETSTMGKSHQIYNILATKSS